MMRRMLDRFSPLAACRSWLAAAAVVVVWAGGVDRSRSARRRTTTSTSTSSTGRSAASRAGRFCSRLAACCRRYWVFTALPSICRDKLPGGYASLGFIIEPGNDLPIGVSQAPAARHRSGRAELRGLPHRHGPRRARRRAANRPRHAGPPARPAGASSQFVLDCTLDNRLTADADPRPAAAERGGPSLFERLLLRFGLVDRLKIQTLNLRNRIAPILADERAALGPRPRRHVQSRTRRSSSTGDLDRLPHDELIGASDFPSLWNQKPREGHAPALGRRQRLGRRAQPERGARRRRDAGDRRSRQR